MSPSDYALFAGLALAAEILGTVSGFGSSLLFVPIAALFFDFKIVLGITAVFHVFSNLSKIYLFREGLDRNIALKLGVPAVAGVIGGALLAGHTQAETGELLMSGALVLFSVFLLVSPHLKIQQTDRNLYGGGIISGFLAGMVGTGGAIRGLTLVAFNLEKQIFIATSAWIDLGVDASRSVIYIANGFFPTEALVLLPVLIGVSLLGSALGKRILLRVSDKIFRMLVLGVVFTISLFQIVLLLI